MNITKAESTALARYFAGRVEKARDGLAACKLSRYADEVCIMLPTSGADFPRFVHWAEAMLATFDRWASLVEVQQTHDGATLAQCRVNLLTLATDARALLARFEAGQLTLTQG